MQYIFLTQQFYDDYSHCTEIEMKQNRPYVLLCITINTIKYAIPLRSNINHLHVFWTDKKTVAVSILQKR